MFARCCAVLTVIMSASSAVSQAWTPVPLVSAQIKDDPSVQIGGEGAQWPQSLAISDAEPAVILYGTDVGGVFRSTDGGETFEPANVGLHARGATDFAFDPRNAERVLLVACNSLAMPQHGLYLSTDAGASWTHVQSAKIAGYRDLREQLAFDPSSFDPDLGYSTDAYWSRVEHEASGAGNPEIRPALYRSLDGGQTWVELPDTTRYGGGFLAVHPTQRGVLYTANRHGLFRSDDRGETWQQLDDAYYTSVHTHPARPDAVWATTASDIRRSDDRGVNWTTLPTAGLEPLTTSDGHAQGSSMVEGAAVSFHDIKLSPADPDRISVSTDPGRYAWQLHTSQDGGQTWANAGFDRSLAFLPVNRRRPVAAWHPRQPDELWSTGMVGDWLGVSRDGGAHFAWAADGINGVLLGGTVRFNTFNPDILFAGSQDYNGALTLDGGQTWTYVNPSGHSWGGFTYGGYALDADTLFVGNSGSWGGPRRLRVSHDRGQTWTEHREVAWTRKPTQANGVAHGKDTAFGHPTLREVAFVAGYRTEDGARSWSALQNCSGVFAATTGGTVTLFGVGSDGQTVVTSQDDGLTWTPLAYLDHSINDLAVTPDGSRLYLAFGGKLGMIHLAEPTRLTLLATPPDQFGNRHIASVAVDPNRPEVVYAAQRMNVYKSDVSAIRSTDGGETWAVLNINTPLDGTAKDGARESIRVIVHPQAGDAWFITSCYGIWKIASPTETDAVAARVWGMPVTVPVSDQPSKEMIRNGGMESGNEKPVSWTLGWVGSGKASLHRIADGAPGQQHALAVELQPGSKATVTQEFRGGGRVVVKGMICTEGQATASVGIKSLPAEGWKVIDQSRATYAGKGQAWKAFEAVIELHADAPRHQFELFVQTPEGESGRVSLDSVSVMPE